MINIKEKESTVSKYVGFTPVKVKAINPTRAQLNELLGLPEGEGNEINYLSQDRDGNDRLRLTFWLYSEVLDKHFAHSFNLVRKERTNNDGTKYQYVNDVCTTAWADEEANLPDWFTKYLDKQKNPIKEKQYRKALMGEQELVTVLRAWLNNVWTSNESSILLDNDLLFSEDYSEIRKLINCGYDSKFLILLGVRTDESDPAKQYQQVWGNNFLPEAMYSGIQSDFNFSTPYHTKLWEKFDSEVNGSYGFNSYFELVPARPYDALKDVAASNATKVDVTPTNAKF